MTSRSVEKFNK